jgi:hypothetical protein
MNIRIILVFNHLKIVGQAPTEFYNKNKAHLSTFFLFLDD